MWALVVLASSALFTFALLDQTSSRPSVISHANAEPVGDSSKQPLNKQQQQQQQQLVFQPALIGFRCEGSSEVTPEGVAVIEANSPVRITLFGESFTTDTIVGFTAEFAPKPDALDQVVAANGKQPSDQQQQQQQELTSTVSKPKTASGATSRSFEGRETFAPLRPLAEPLNRTISRLPVRPRESLLESRATTQLSEQEIRARRHRRRLLDRSYDCTDYDRIISYRLTEANIITPNVATLTINLPELDTRPGMFYYFCVKQPLLHSIGGGGAALAQDWMRSQAPVTDDESSSRPPPTGLAPFRPASDKLQSAAGAAANNSQQLFWVHQGDEWWLMLKVEPPILSIANDCILIVLLLFLSAVTSGLNLGLMSLDMNELAVISSCGDPRERSYARTIAPLRKRGNYLLCSLLLGNVMVNSTLTVILEEMTSGLVAVIGSTLAIVVLGEIVPQAFCARQGLAIGARTIYLTYAFMLITFPLSYPISCLLDCVLGEEKGNVYDRERLMEFIRITGNHTQLEADEVAIISGALKLKKIRVEAIMTRIEDVFMLPIDCMLDRRTIRSIIEKGYSRIPIYELNDRKQIVALILAKDLALLDPDDQMPLANMLKYCKHPLVFIDDSATLDVALNEFKTGKSHLAIVRQIYDDGEVDKYYEAIGVVTLEDVIEEVLQTEINDETDTLSDNRRKRRRTDAQVAHLVDELIENCSPATAAAVAPNLKAIVASAQQQQLVKEQQMAQQAKELQDSLSSTKF